jgi:hypothetical protein
MEDNTKDGYVDWLMTYKWNWSCTLNLRNGIRRKSATRLWREWITRLEEIEGHYLSWARMAEFGETSGKLHFHGVVAGVCRTSPEGAAALWLHMAGDAKVGVLFSVKRWIEYMLKEMEVSDDYDFDFELQDQDLRRRKLSTAPSRNSKLSE